MPSAIPAKEEPRATVSEDGQSRDGWGGRAGRFSLRAGLEEDKTLHVV